MRNAFMDEILEYAMRYDDLFILSGDAGLGVFDTFKEKKPERFVNLGVAEQNAIGFAAGLLLSGYKVLVYNIVPFSLYRCYEQVRNDIGYQELPLILVGIGSGVTYAPQGMTHYSLEDIALASTIPNMTIFSPIDPLEAKAVAQACLQSATPTYVRLAKRGEPNLHESACGIDPKKPHIVSAGKEVALVTHGSIALEAFEAKEMLRKEGIDVAIISMPMIEPFDGDALHALCKEYKAVISVEEHYAQSGLGSKIVWYRNSASLDWKFTAMGFPKKFIHEIYDTQGLRAHYGVDASAIVKVAKQLIQGS